jgi:hypothetical protein
MTKLSVLVAGAVFLALSHPAASQQVFFYPTKGQTPQQQQADHGQCHVWAVQQSGFDPARVQVAPQGAPPPQSSALRGAARGAAVGAVGGAIGGDAGKGAAIGAGVGALFGGARRRQQESQYRAQVQQQQAAISQQQANYTRALSACMSGKGYSVQ